MHDCRSLDNLPGGACRYPSTVSRVLPSRSTPDSGFHARLPVSPLSACSRVPLAWQVVGFPVLVATAREASCRFQTKCAGAARVTDSP